VTVADSARDARWILRAQLPDGAIATHLDRAVVWPDLANFAAIGLAESTRRTGERRYLEGAWRWLAWYQAHQDADGFVTDYRRSGGAMVSTGDMDSTDAFAGTFLLAARAALKASGDKARLATLRRGVGLAVHAIEATQDHDGLTWAKPAWRVKYLMDQAETYAGLRAAAGELAHAQGDQALADRAMDDRPKAGFLMREEFAPEGSRRTMDSVTAERFLNAYHIAGPPPSPDVPEDLASFVLAADRVPAEAAELARVLARAYQGAATQRIGEGRAHARKSSPCKRSRSVRRIRCEG
jgi:hypothetical protein